jgi:5-methylcytosine-specific restriction endonuclease McrA
MPRRKKKKDDKPYEFRKAQQYRSSWRRRCKKSGGNLNDIPVRKVIQEWLVNQKPYTCYITNDLLKETDVEADHIQPISRGGSFKLSNVGLTSKRMNQIKGDMTISELHQLLELVSKWEDKGKSLFKRLLSSSNIYRRRS